jgi:hypothetical protein
MQRHFISFLILFHKQPFENKILSPLKNWVLFMKNLIKYFIKIQRLKKELRKNRILSFYLILSHLWAANEPEYPAVARIQIYYTT